VLRAEGLHQRRQQVQDRRAAGGDVQLAGLQALEAVAELALDAVQPSTSGRASSYRAGAARVRVRRRPSRSNSGTSSCRSSACSCRVTAGWLRNRASAARDTEPSRATWQKARKGFMRSPL
jgi:hypothetical protein